MALDVYTSDAKLLEELSALLKTDDFVLTQTPRADGVSNSSIAGSWLSVGSANDSDTSSNAKRDAAVALKRKIRREKEILRKQRYQRRLKLERETLRRMEKTLTARLLQVKQAHDTRIPSPGANVVQSTAVSREFAELEGQERFRAEEEQKRLIDAVTTQASYLATLRDLLADQGASIAPSCGV
ncbi:hypothetical protein PC129_g24604 [Phytophthora cactorum]|uniref:Uncharacterized protein n=1 Tax=Phytophthora cactorum TaxID=29920 RepID=A0A329S8N0_9STRA|nr:hypothetical protein PC111_g24696 [Phytophthora cactorum]KAG2781220.1 hypothetical protein PC112_g24876 [Phytophthora cactorum]KAG2790070.1 hypothetical protein Pcac1_g1253 [Phytophthora cactorum]KAG2800196.1 hypothetical protein PC113_g24735 [Phytophthora cactorum]KAG2868890.1 hypothetical protein PC114_g27802 [Phytophthora cactorum]